MVANSEYWIRINLATELCLKEGLISILHNTDNDTSYVGLPNDPHQLFQRMQQCQQNRNHDLHKVLKQEQWNVLCPPNQQTNSNDWDVTLLVAVIRSELKLNPLGGWKIKQLQGNDQSKGAYVYLIRNLRNELKHGSINEIDTFHKFTTYWNRIEYILKGINYKNMPFFNNLKTDPLDKHAIATNNTVKQLEKDKIIINKKFDGIKTSFKHVNDSKANKEDLKGNHKELV